MAEVVSEFTITTEQVHDYEFVVRFDKPPSSLVTDELPPLGHEAGPSPSRLLAAAVANCLSASLVFCARKARVNLDRVRTEVKVQTIRNERKRLRIGGIEVTIDPGFADAGQVNAGHCLDIFEDYCTVTESVRAGIDIKVNVKGRQRTLPAAEAN